MEVGFEVSYAQAMPSVTVHFLLPMDQDVDLLAPSLAPSLPGVHRVGLLWCKAQTCTGDPDEEPCRSVLQVELLLALESSYQSLKPAPVDGQSRRHWKSTPHLEHPWKKMR